MTDPGKRVDWQERRGLIRTEFPEAVEPDWGDVLNDDAAFERMMRDILKFAQAEQGRDGPRPNLDWDKGMQTWREITGQDFTGLPFQQAFREIARDRSGREHSLSHISNKTGISRSRVHRLITGREAPDMQVMALIAGGYGKKPQFFAEYRAEIIAQRVISILARNPEYSAVVYRKVVGSA